MKRRKHQKTRTPGGRKRARKQFGRLAYSCLAKNVPEGAAAANEALVARVAAKRVELGIHPEDATRAVAL